MKLAEVAREEDATLIEVNPLIVTADREVVALDAKVTIDGNALFRHQDLAEIADTVDDPQEQMAKEKGLTYVKLDGNVGILANGAGLCMSTLDVVAQAGGAPANFLDAGGGSKAEAIVNALEVIKSDAKVERDPLQHLRRHHPLRRDRQGDRHRLAADRPRAAAGRPPRRHQLRGGAGDPRRGRPAEPAPGEDDARRRPPRRRARRERRMSIIVDERHEARRLRPDRPRGLLPRPPQQGLRDRPRRRRDARARAARTSRARRSSTRSRRPSRRPAPTPR